MVEHVELSMTLEHHRGAKIRVCGSPFRGSSFWVSIPC